MGGDWNRVSCHGNRIFIATGAFPIELLACQVSMVCAANDQDISIVEFPIPGYPGPSKDQGTEVRLMRGKIFRGKIRM